MRVWIHCIRAGGPQRQRTFSPAEKLAHLVAYEQVCQTNGGGGYLRREGLHSSLISEWRKQRDAGVLEGKPAGAKLGRLTAEQAEIARLRRELDKTTKRLATTEVALQIMGKAHALLESLLRERGAAQQADQALMDAWNELRTNTITTREAAVLTGMYLLDRDPAGRAETDTA